MVLVPDVPPEIDAFHREAVVVDLHTHSLLNATYLGRDMGRRRPAPTGWNPLQNAVDLPRAVEGGVDVLVFTAYIPFAFPLALRADRAIGRVFDVFDRFVAANPDRVGHARGAAEARSIVHGGRVAAVLAVEGGHVLAGRLENVERFAARGVAYITLTHFFDNWVAASSVQPLHWKDGLRPRGRDVIREMNRCGIIVDASHCSDRAYRDVAGVCEGPFIATHNGIRAMAPGPRNISDEQIDLVARSGGVVGIITFPLFLKNRWRAGLDAVVDSVKYVADRAGIDHVAIGSDMDGFTNTVDGLDDMSHMPRLTRALLDRGLSREDARKVMGENTLRVLDAAWGRKE